jgi:hypothetical protein
MRVVLVALGLISMTGGAVLLMPYSYAWMERMGWARRWVYGLALLALGVGLLGVAEVVS